MNFQERRTWIIGRHYKWDDLGQLLTRVARLILDGHDYQYWSPIYQIVEEGMTLADMIAAASIRSDEHPVRSHRGSEASVTFSDYESASGQDVRGDTE